MIYAPIMIPTLCRHKHFIRLIESLKKNSWAKYTDIYVGLDYPPSEKYLNGYNKIIEYLNNEITEFASFNVIKHDHNLGSLANTDYLRHLILQKYDRFIYTDDDAEFSHNFIEYMDKCLMEYEDDPSVIAVTGYSYPIKWKVSENSTIFKENFICSMWGTGFWVDKYKIIKNQIENGCLQQSVDYVMNNNLMDRMLEVSKVEYVNLCLSPIFKETLACKMTDIAIRMYTAINDMYIICPVISKVRNWGFDGSGEYCFKVEESDGHINSRTFLYNKQFIDQSLNFDVIVDKCNLTDKNRKLLNKFEDLSWQIRLKVYIKIFLYKTLGSENYNIIKNKLKK